MNFPKLFKRVTGRSPSSCQIRLARRDEVPPDDAKSSLQGLGAMRTRGTTANDGMRVTASAKILPLTVGTTKTLPRRKSKAA
jgi:hypothetical protein